MILKFKITCIICHDWFKYGKTISNDHEIESSKATMKFIIPERLNPRWLQIKDD